MPTDPARRAAATDNFLIVLKFIVIRYLKSRVNNPAHSPCSASQRSASSAAMQPVPAAVTAWR